MFMSEKQMSLHFEWKTAVLFITTQNYWYVRTAKLAHFTPPRLNAFFCTK